WRATGVSIDSRSLKTGDLFVAIVGPNFDGHDYVAEAFASGAAAAIVSRPISALPAGAPLLEVGDSLDALKALAGAARRRSNAKVVAVTGSVGKTSTKDALTLALSALGPTHASSGNLNNEYGMPLSLARMAEDSRYGVLEMGMNHAGELAPLSRLTKPHVAIITNIGAAHLEFFDGVAGIAEAKAEIFEGMSPDGVAVLNRDNAYFAYLADAAWQRGITQVIGFGADPDGEARLLDYTPSADGDGSSVHAEILGQEITYRIGATGQHWALNSLAVLAAVAGVGGDVPRAAGALASFNAPRGRGQRRTVILDDGSFTLIDDSYNAGPASMRAAVAVLGATAPGAQGRRIAVLGDMLELGREAEAMHVAIARDLIAAQIDKVYAAGPHMAALMAVLPKPMCGAYADSGEALLPMVLAAVRDGDAVLVKGSLGSRMGPIVDGLANLAQPTAQHAVCGR
ncbi:MAG: UDP-N-acetylmuramoylalanyl-D-glutamyl-2,6-diaminopimelate--D-alanyl-D-alanine ligase, partial [Alphaproteobacteria bacterium]